MAKKEEVPAIFPLRTINVSLPGELTDYTGKDFAAANKHLAKWKYPCFETETFATVFPSFERDADQILFIILVFWWGSPYAANDMDNRITMAAEALGWYAGSPQYGDIIKMKAHNMSDNINRFCQAQNLRAWDMHNKFWHTQIVMLNTLLENIGKPDQEFDQKHVVTWKASLAADLPILTANQIYLCEKVRRTESDVKRMMTATDIKQQAKTGEGDTKNFNI